MVIPEWLFKEERTPFRKTIRKVCNPQTLKQLARDRLNWMIEN